MITIFKGENEISVSKNAYEILYKRMGYEIKGEPKKVENTSKKDESKKNK